MGASDWVGYATSSNPSSAYAAYPNPLQSSYGYEGAIASEHHPHHHSNMHLTLPEVPQNYCPSDYYHHSNNSSLGALSGGGQTAVQQSGNTTASAYSTPKLEIEASYSPSAYNNWSSSYNYNHQYANCAPPSAAAVPPTAPAMLLYGPHVYSTVNQNQIHLHLHGGPEKLDHFLNDSSFTISSISAGGTGGTGPLALGGSRPEIDIGPADNTIGMLANEPSEHQQHAHHHDHEIVEAHHTENGDPSAVGDPGSVWRPY
jgi:hypothetical protein